MNILISGAAGNLGTHLTRHLIRGPHALRLLVHGRPVPADITAAARVAVYRADLDDPATLDAPCRGTDCIVHFAGVLFAPRPERFLPRTNVGYVRNLVAAAVKAVVTKFILIGFPQVESRRRSTPPPAASTARRTPPTPGRAWQPRSTCSRPARARRWCRSPRAPARFTAAEC